jgi:hypothetical protein
MVTKQEINREKVQAALDNAMSEVRLRDSTGGNPAH